MPLVYLGTGWFIGIALASALRLPIELLLIGMAWRKLTDRQWNKIEVLLPRPVAHPKGGRPTDRARQAEQQLDRGGLARSVRSQEAEYFSRTHFKRKVVHCNHVLETAGELGDCDYSGTLPWKFRGTPYERVIDPDGLTTEHVRVWNCDQDHPNAAEGLNAVGLRNSLHCANPIPSLHPYLPAPPVRREQQQPGGCQQVDLRRAGREIHPRRLLQWADVPPD